ncbi:ycf20-like protein [Aristolochia californica]|uniref:ycf20-like protein n=1 Tax=Aristolochia californica TaxID=171875 RepID=UPI0035DF7811
MVIGGKLATLPAYPRKIIFPSSKCFKSRFLVVQSHHKSVFAFRLRKYPGLHFCDAAALSLLCNSKRVSWCVCSLVDGDRSDPSESSTDGRTRLIRAVQDFQTKLNARVEKLKEGLPVKVFFFLVGFYCATAFSTVIGQTGDWDILSAGLAVVVVEGIGALMYKASLPLLDKLRRLITIFNYWKAGLSLGLFLDAFKYEMDMLLELINLFKEIDMLPKFW